MLDVKEALVRIIVALLAGLLIGLEREKARAVAEERRKGKPSLEEMVVKEIPGLRTFALISLYASSSAYAYSAHLIDATALIVLIAAFAGVATVYAAYRLVISRAGGITTVVVMLVDYIIGLLAGLGATLVAAALAVLTAFMLAIKLPAEKIVGRIRYEELLWSLELAIVLIVVGPFFLTSNIGFFGVSLKSLYLFFALVLTTSYLGYIAVRLKGVEGIAYLALFGGFANSEATTMACLEMIGSEERKKLSLHVVVLTNTAMVVRSVFIALIAGMLLSGGTTSLKDYLGLLTGAIIASVPAYFSWHYLIVHKVLSPPKIENPLSFGIALKSTLLYLALALLAVVAAFKGVEGLLLFSALGGFVNAGATILSLFSVQTPPAASHYAALAIAAAMLNKSLYAYIATRDLESVKRVAVITIVHAVAFLAVVSFV